MTNQPNLCHIWVDSSQNQHGPINRLDVRISTQLWQNLTWFRFMFQLIYLLLARSSYIVQVDPSATIATYHLTRPTWACCSKPGHASRFDLLVTSLLYAELNRTKLNNGSSKKFWLWLVSDSELLSCRLVQFSVTKKLFWLGVTAHAQWVWPSGYGYGCWRLTQLLKDWLEQGKLWMIQYIEWNVKQIKWILAMIKSTYYIKSVYWTVSILWTIYWLKCGWHKFSQFSLQSSWF